MNKFFKNIEDLKNNPLGLNESDLKLYNKIQDLIESSGDTYVYIKSVAKFYWVKKKKFFTPSETAFNMKLSVEDLKKARWWELIKDYDDFCYSMAYIEWSFNLLDPDSILTFWNAEIKLNASIEKLIHNVCGYKKENIEWLFTAILYKYINIDDHKMPCVILYWAGWSGKWTLINLLWEIFWNENILANLWYRDLISNFDTYKWNKLIVEYAEVISRNKNDDYKVLNKLKNIVGAEYITVNDKWVKPYQMKNSAWFFISSNSNTPVQLDDKDKWNRRFTVIRSDSKLTEKDAIKIYEAIRNTQIIREFLAWLFHTYKEVVCWKWIQALNNQDKKDLEDRVQNEANTFWDWFEEGHQDIISINNRIKKSVIDEHTQKYCNEIGVSYYEFNKFFIKNSRYPYKKFRDWKETFYGFEIPKK